ncbi:exonuclease domain-containing protein [Roseibacterium sp. SDUM158016]|uniref:3'-5' exonuclease n=1 Tax=Roseicyclus sediminis TaxID=2980997 RepID=UPI0021D10233|nr:exonuclease domain-containing protein [Roseibacterium sp. SDUM158016]MCU4653048.1 exonuclease domain-containing protein [Roseibacterium sp. SDUM158016]
MFTTLSLRLRIFLFFAFLAAATSALAVAGLVLGYVRLGEDHALSAFVISGVIAVLAIFALTTWIWVLFDENVAKPVERLAAEMRARAHADVDDVIDHAPAKYLGDLGTAAAAVTTNLTETRNAMALAVGRETARLTTEKTRLEALLAEVPDGVLFCTPGHSIALYNANARGILGASEALGLNRPLRGLLRMGPVEQAYERLVGKDGDEGTDILVTTREGARLLEARMRLLRLEGQETERPGYVLTLRDVTEDMATHMERTHLLETLLKGVQDALPGIQGDAAASLATLAEATETRKGATDTGWWPMEHIAAEDLGAALTARLSRKGVALASDLGATALRCDGFAVTRLMERLALDWSGDGAREFALTIASEGDREAIVSLEASGDIPTAEAVAGWLATPLSPGMSGFTGANVALAHGTAILREPAGPGRSALRFALPLAEARPARPKRAVLYDFDLLNAEIPEDLAAAALRELNFVIFDTETTGLNPQVDEICQIAAVRVVNGKLVGAERFDMLVNPGRGIPAASTAVHHITDAMVADAPGVAEAIRRFHTFADGAVLVAHNAPFDMSFLRRREREIGRRFDQPILDTVLCSAILFGQSAEHTLDALCTRLGVAIPEADRHTAIGDAIGTGEAFRKMIPMLEAADLPNLGALIQAFDRHSRLIEHLN